MAAELGEAVVPTSLTSADENILTNGAVNRSSHSVLTELDRVSPGFYNKRTSMPSAFVPTENGQEVVNLSMIIFQLFLFSMSLNLR